MSCLSAPPFDLYREACVKDPGGQIYGTFFRFRCNAFFSESSHPFSRIIETSVWMSKKKKGAQQLLEQIGITERTHNSFSSSQNEEVPPLQRAGVKLREDPAKSETVIFLLFHGVYVLKRS